MLTAPNRAPYPEDMRGSSILFVGVCSAGDIPTGRRAVDGLRAATTPDLDFVREMPYSELQRMLDDGHGWGEPWYEKAAYAAEITPEALATFGACWERRVPTRDQMYAAEGRPDRPPRRRRDAVREPRDPVRLHGHERLGAQARPHPTRGLGESDLGMLCPPPRTATSRSWCLRTRSPPRRRRRPCSGR
jgi:hypothetical protein